LRTSRKKILFETAVILIIASLLPNVILSTQAQIAINFTPADKFSIPQYNGSISFGFNGSYAKAVLENDSWTFSSLRLNGSRPLRDLKISAQNSNITILLYSSYVNSTRAASLRYTAEGQGIQIVNLGLNLTQQSNAYQWTVVIPGKSGSVFLAENEHWKFLPNDTLMIYGLSGNVTVTRYGFSVAADEGHSVAIVTAALVAATVAVAVAIRFKVRR
jgi:hypothetical protein